MLFDIPQWYLRINGVLKFKTALKNNLLKKYIKTDSSVSPLLSGFDLINYKVFGSKCHLCNQYE